MKKLLSALLAVLMAAALPPVSSLAVNTAGADAPVNPQAVVPAGASGRQNGADENEPVLFMVKLKGSPVAESAEELGSEKALALTGVLKNRQARALEDIRSIFPSGVECRVRFSYTLLFNGFAIEAPYYMMDRIAGLAGVEKVFRAPAYSAPQAADDGDTRLATSVGLINADDAWAAGYTGAGSTIAILDTGCVLAHNAFSVSPPRQSMTAGTLGAALAQYDLQAERKFGGGLTAGALYYSGKIPFRFNYDNGTTNVAHSYAGNDHGSHVAGIAAGNYSGSSYTGVAKDAQLIIMQVFDVNGVSNWPVVLAAMEDCAYLGADSLNMSLGNDMGFTTDGGEVDRVYELLSQHGVNVAVAAGNSGSANRQYYGSEYPNSLAMNPDCGVVASPATYTGSLCVASCGKSSSAAPSAFTSRGTTADLKLKPEITAPGEKIYAPTDSAFSGATTGYGRKTGTSMSAPHIAGAMAILEGYARDTWPQLSKEERARMADTLLMCTANPLFNSSGVPYSPRAQGSGEADLLKAVTTRAYITVKSSVRPKLEIGDDKSRTGVFSFSFNVVNFGSTSLTYTVNPYVITENAVQDTLDGSTVYRMDCTPKSIIANCAVSCPGTVTVQPGSTKTVSVTIALNSSIKGVLDTVYPNGAFIEGYVMLDGAVDLSVPFLGFYGNWNEASVFDRYTYIDAITGGNNFRYMTEQIVVGARNGGSAFLFGANPYAASSDWLADRCTLSPNGDGYYEQIDNVVLALIRNAEVCGISISSADDPSLVYYDEEYYHMPKTWFFRDSYYSYATDLMRFESWAPEGLAEGTHLLFRMYAYLDNPGFTPKQNECCEIALPMTVDVTPPVITYWRLAANMLTLRVYDEHYAAWVGVYSDPACTHLIAESAIAESGRGAYTDLNFKVGSCGRVYVRTGDYGRNTSPAVMLTGEGGSLAPVRLSGVTVAPEVTELTPDMRSELTLARYPAEARDFDVVWASSDESVATVAGGRYGAVVSGHAAGTALITATATDRNTGEVFTDTAYVYTYSAFGPCGDVNCDGEVGFSDVSLFSQYLAGQAALTPRGMLNADMNTDGESSFADVGAIYHSIVG